MTVPFQADTPASSSSPDDPFILAIFGLGARHPRPLCELVDCNVQVLKAPDSSGKGAEDVEPPDRKWPG